MNKRVIAVGALVVAALLVGLYFALPTPRLGDAPPRGADPTKAPEPEVSVLVVDVAVPYAALAETVEAGVPEVFLDEKGTEFGEGNLVGDVRGERTGPVVVSARNDRLLFELPMLITLKVYSEKKANKRAERGGKAPAGVRVTAKLVVEMEYLFGIEDDWGMTATSALSHRWLDKPIVQWGPFKFGIEKLADKSLKKVWADTAAGIDAQMAENPGFGESMRKTWTDLGSPRKTSETPEMWWLAEPTALYAGQQVAGEDALELVAGIGGRFALVMGDPGPQPALPPFPNRADPPDDVGIRLALPLTLQWQAMTDAAADAVVAQTWTLPVAGADVGTLTAMGVELYPSGVQVVVALDYTASNPAWDTDGTVYFTGRPVLDSTAGTVRIEDFDYVIDTWDPAVANANALAESGLKDLVQQSLSFEYGEQLDETRRTASAGLTRTTEDGGEMTGSLDRLEVTALRVTDKGIVLDALATGSLALTTGLEPR